MATSGFDCSNDVSKEIVKPVLFTLFCLVTSVQFGNTEVTVNGVTIFVTDAHRLLKLSGNSSVLTSVPKTLGIDYDSKERRLYWVTKSPPSIQSADINLEDTTTLANLSGAELSHLAIEEESRKIFYTNIAKSEIVIMDLNGSNARTLLNRTSVTSPWKIIIHSIKRRIIWNEHDRYKKILSADFDGNNIRRIVNIVSLCYGLAVDEEADILYWTGTSGWIRSISLNGSNERDFYRHTSGILLVLSLIDKTLYFTALRDQIYRISVDGGEAEVISNTTIVEPGGIYVLSDKAAVRECDPGFYGTGGILSCTDRMCFNSKCDSGIYGSRCSLSCTDRKCMDSSSGCDHVTGDCDGGCQAGYKEPDCREQCESGIYGSRCSLSCTDRKCMDSSSGCDHVTGDCDGGCQAGYKEPDCREPCPAGTFGRYCTSCGTRHCQGESDCPVDGACSQGCQDGFIGLSCTQTENDPSTALLVAYVLGAVFGTLVIALLVLVCLYRQGRLQCVRAGPFTVDSMPRDNMAGQQPAAVSHQAVAVSQVAETSGYDVLNPETLASATDYRAIESPDYVVLI